MPLYISLLGEQHADNELSVYFCYPETSNLSLEEVDNLFLPEEHQVRASSISYAPGRPLSEEDSMEKGNASYAEEKI